MLDTKRIGVTLAETLIVLGIIGVVAALTIPNLINNYKAQRLRTKFQKTYSLLQQGFKQMEADDVSLDPATYPYNAPFYHTYIKYFTGVVNCGRLNMEIDNRSTPCYYTRAYKYRDLSGKSTIDESLLDDGQFVLPDGTIIFFENTSLNGVWVTADLNGLDKPNRWGVDLFTFQFIEGELRTMGSDGTKYTDLDTYCNYKISNNLNGIACAKLAKSDSEYFKKVIKYK